MDHHNGLAVIPEEEDSASNGSDSEDSLTVPTCATGSYKTVCFDISDEYSDNNDTKGSDVPVSPIALSSPSSSSSNRSLPKLKATMSFIKAYKAMRGPRDTEPSPLFSCLEASQRQSANVYGAQDNDDHPFRLAVRDKIRFSLQFLDCPPAPYEPSMNRPF